MASFLRQNESRMISAFICCTYCPLMSTRLKWPFSPTLPENLLERKTQGQDWKNLSVPKGCKKYFKRFQKIPKDFKRFLKIRRPHKVSVGLRRSQKISEDLNRSQKISKDLKGSQKISKNLKRRQKTSKDLKQTQRTSKYW